MIGRAGLGLLLVSLLALSLGAAPAPVHACQLGCTPIHLILTYLPNVSNWGPEKATGVVELVLAEGEARGQVTGLPALVEERYQAWLVNNSTDEALPFGTFTTDQEGRAQFRFILDEDIPDRGWNLFLLTVEPVDDPAPDRQSDQRSIGAFFAGIEQQHLTPRELPNTGGPLSLAPTPAEQALAPDLPPVPAAPAMTSPADRGVARMTRSEPTGPSGLPDIGVVGALGLASLLLSATLRAQHTRSRSSARWRHRRSRHH